MDLSVLAINYEALPIWANSLIVLVSIVVIGQGAHWLVESAAQIANRLGISELIIGLTVVALGTSAPEFAVTITAAFKGQGNISVGNIVGSNIFNLGFILGGAALFRAIPTNRKLLMRDGAVLFITSVLLLLIIGIDLRLDRYDGVLLALGLVVYLGILFKQRKAPPGAEEEVGELVAAQRTMARNVVFLLVGLAFVLGGSHVLVDSATAIARAFKVSEWVIGVTIVAAGTSAPEFATTLAGVLKNRFDISAGNLIGSDIFNLLGVLGVAGILRPVEVDAMARLSLAALMVMVLLALLFMRTGWRISRLEGLILVLIAAARWTFDFTTRMSGS
jgi:cation:H+ antiporter